ncbi:hypothetical protein NC651_032852 [Populus alba x Populus x berolinensis]|nr:hypothetical protein NC651_032852 [Populus alba x Populus x berolinensis]
MVRSVLKSPDDRSKPGPGFKRYVSTGFPGMSGVPTIDQRCAIKMPQVELRNNSPEIKEPSHKIPKLQQNGVHEAAPIPSSLLKVKKLSESAALPSRCSLLAAGYDLSRY